MLKDDEPWFTAEGIGRALGYAEPRKAIMKTLERNRDEFEGFHSVVKLTTEAGVRDTTVFSIEALNLICMFSNQPKAKEFREK